ncbi:MAG TPA: peptidoglycan editing factor PgeF [Gammaproteobacteria bacterium]|nr:peptidoglycan editing factor PgeF [Gammaproteobacteria bacterium]
MPAGVKAFVTTRAGGVSTASYASFNLGDHVGDDPAAVATNRRLLRSALALPSEPCWLRQVHGRGIVRFEGRRSQEPLMADGAVSAEPGVVLAVLTADCLPVLLAARDASEVAIVHAGWRGLAAGVIESAVGALGAEPEDLCAWLGPAIGAAHYEVGEEVRAAFRGSAGAGEAFAPSPRRGHWRCDLAALARARLRHAGVPVVLGGGFCTFADRERFYSYRRDGETGRMASLIWRAAA